MQICGERVAASVDCHLEAGGYLQLPDDGALSVSGEGRFTGPSFPLFNRVAGLCNCGSCKKDNKLRKPKAREIPATNGAKNHSSLR